MEGEDGGGGGNCVRRGRKEEGETGSVGEARRNHWWEGERSHHMQTCMVSCVMPQSCTMFGWRNWAMIRASWRNLTLSSAEALLLSFFTATLNSPCCDDHTALWTVAK